MITTEVRKIKLNLEEVSRMKSINLEYKDTLDTSELKDFNIETLLPDKYKNIAQFLFVIGISNDIDQGDDGVVSFSNHAVQILTPSIDGIYTYRVILYTLDAKILYSRLTFQVGDSDPEDEEDLMFLHYYVISILIGILLYQCMPPGKRKFKRNYSYQRQIEETNLSDEDDHRL